MRDQYRISLRKHSQCALAVLLAAALLARFSAIAVDASLGVLAQPPIVPGHCARASALAGAWLDGQFAVPLGELAPQSPRTNDLMRILVAHLLAPFYMAAAPLTDGIVVGRIAVAVYSLTLGPLAYALAREVGLGERLAVGVAGMTLFWPSIVYRSIVIQREVLITLATLTAVWVTMRWARGAATGGPAVVVHAAVLAAAGGMVAALRAENLLVLATVLVVAVAVRYRKRVEVLVATGTTAIAGFALVATYPVTFIGRRSLTPAILDEYAHARAHGDAAYLTWLHYDSWLDIALFPPLKVVYFLGSPLPWRVDGPATLLAGVSGWLLLTLTVPATYGVAAVARRESVVDRCAVAVLAVFLVVGVTAYAIIEMNGGAAFRRRIQFVPIVLIFTAVALSTLQHRITTERSADTSEYAPADSANTLTADSE